LSLLFQLSAWLRRLAYRTGMLRVVHLPVPVIVVGNIAAGGSGKTPLVLWLVERLRQKGWPPGIISRGYGGRCAGTCAVEPDSDPRHVGDEPLLLRVRAQVPVFIGRDRPAAGEALLRMHPDVRVLVADDGLQHYRLGREVEVVVVGGDAPFGNGFRLPAGPLREGRQRLREADAIVVNGGSPGVDMAGDVPVYTMRLEGDTFFNLRDAAAGRTSAAFRDEPLTAVAGIGQPGRFFDHLRGLGLSFSARSFPDHHVYRETDLPRGGQVLMTEKDAVKCAGFDRDNCWVLPVTARVEGGLEDLIFQRLKGIHGQQAA
jgi:tetraacyldisaccharide 4'-kinase